MALVSRLSARMNWSGVAAVTGLASSVLVSTFATPYMVIATVNYFTLILGLTYLRRDPRQRRKHAILMATAAVSDFTLVLILEFQRHAVQEAINMSLSLPNRLHIVFSLLAVLLYFPILYLGIRLLRGAESSLERRRLHRKLGVLAFCFRSLGFALMFSLLGIHHIK